MKTFNEIKQIVDAQDELNMLDKPQSLTREEYKYYLSTCELEGEIKSLRLELDIKEAELSTRIANPDHFRYNEGL
jgi:hypothetical protein